MSLEGFLNGPASMSLAFGLSRAIPPRLGLWLADQIGFIVSQQRKSSQIMAVEANQSVVGQGRLTVPKLRQITKATFQSKARNIYDFYHYFDNPKSIREMVEIDPSFLCIIEQQRKNQKGLVIVSPHFSNFDLALRAAILAGMRAQVLVYSQIFFGYRFQNQIRGLEGLELTLPSFSGLQKALQRLKNGGIVITGVDRPINGNRYRPIFFGRPSSLPVSHVQLALKADVPVMVVSGKTLPDGHYCIQASDPIPMQRFNDHDEEALWNAEQILKVIEPIIRWDPKQWSMFYRVWPETIIPN